MLARGVELAEACWHDAPSPATPLMARHRYKGEAVPAFRQKGGDRVVFAAPQPGVAPGQACVLYAGSRLVGGGWIARSEPAAGWSAAAVPALDLKESAA
jgi:tRNA U34 2-thiouridine synthase MnmA/TrmU